MSDFVLRNDKFDEIGIKVDDLLHKISAKKGGILETIEIVIKVLVLLIVIGVLFGIKAFIK